MDIFARISEPYQTLEGVLQSLANDCEKLVVYEHAGTRVHVHFYAVGMRIKTDALKVRIKKHLNVTVYDKTRWSFKTAVMAGVSRICPRDTSILFLLKAFLRMR